MFVTRSPALPLPAPVRSVAVLDHTFQQMQTCLCVHPNAQIIINSLGDLIVRPLPLEQRLRFVSLCEALPLVTCNVLRFIQTVIFLVRLLLARAAAALYGPCNAISPVAAADFTPHWLSWLLTCADCEPAAVSWQANTLN